LTYRGWRPLLPDAIHPFNPLQSGVEMSNVTTLRPSDPLLQHRLIAADLITQSEETRQKANKYAECFAGLESVIDSLNGAKRHGYRIRFRSLQSELKAAIDELMTLEGELIDIRRYLARQAAVTTKRAPSDAEALPAKVAGQHPVGLPKGAAEVGQV
jgi:hypothetical protein